MLRLSRHQTFLNGNEYPSMAAPDLRPRPLQSMMRSTSHPSGAPFWLGTSKMPTKLVDSQLSKIALPRLNEGKHET